MIDSWPSWVPRRYFYSREDRTPLVLGKTLDVERPRIVDSASDAHILQLKGLVAGTVDQQTRQSLPSDNLHMMQIWMIEALTLMRFHPYARAHWSTSYATKTLLAGGDINGQPLKTALYGFQQFLEEIWRQQLLPYKLSRAPNQEQRMASLFHRRFRQTCRDRRLFITKDGQCGLGPEAMKPGDVVAIFHGVWNPYILREVGNVYLVVGHCYLEGAQEAYDRHKEDEDVVFNLRYPGKTH